MLTIGEKSPHYASRQPRRLLGLNSEASVENVVIVGTIFLRPVGT
ncbi:hypothetical protein [Spirosoma utsteinense]|uniref:Uncharacterized protein n=1 Tax=Spirosoma utsteinense TaxID=2585773 RepID=A0ABR6WAZ9_9BACT|nr:hypothetical protein [Spirosoma utsteinense]MBC3793734.1 hypothetical protein [Spirosoma utsteinense]